MESHKNIEDNDEDSKNTNWCEIFMAFRSRGFSESEILQLSYPKFKAYMENLNNPIIFPLVVPYMGDGSQNKDEKLDTKEELLNIVADMNKEFR